MKDIRKRRIAAVIFDEFLVSGLIVLLVFILIIASLETFTIEAVESLDTTVFQTQIIIGSVLFSLIYYTIIPYFLNGATLGKLLANITVVTSTGGKADFVALLKRNIRFIFGLLSGVLLTLNSPESINSTLTLISWGFYFATFLLIMRNNGDKSLTDILGETKVIYTKEEYQSIEETQI